MPKFLIGLLVILVGIGLFVAARKSPDQLTSAPVVIKGSDTEVQLVSNLVESFSQDHTGADISVTGGGSSVGIAALINGEIDIANSSRSMKTEEREQAKSRGFATEEFIIARDGLSAIVHPSNAVTQLTVEQLAKMYRGEITNWREIGGPDRPITLYGRQSTSGTYGFFRDTIVKADYAASMRNMEGNQAIFDAVAQDQTGIGYIGVGYAVQEGRAREGVKILSVQTDAGSPAVSPLDKEAVLAGRYPIVRPIYQYLKELPLKDSLIDELLRFEVSAAGQAIVEQSGFYPITDADREQNERLFARTS